MKHAGYTPGPWRVEPWTYGEGRRVVLTIQTDKDAVAQVLGLYRPTGPHGDQRECEANAALIASAPAMAARIEELEALAATVGEALAKCLNEDGSWDEMPAAYKRSLLNQACAALAKATP